MTSEAEELLLQALGGDVDPAATAESLLAQLAGDDPRLALLTKLMLDARAAAPEPAPAAAAIDLGELEELRQRNEALAAALGACFVCWGTDIFCTHCGGEGRRGATAPDPRLFNQLVAPAVARAGAIPTEGGERE